MTKKLFYRLCVGLTDSGTFYPVEKSPYDIVKNLDQEIFKSVYYYTEEQVTEANKMIMVKNPKDDQEYERKRGIGRVTSTDGTQYQTVTDVFTNQLIFDLDSVDFKDVRRDTKTLVGRLEEHGIGEESIQLYFSGGKGTHVRITTDKIFNPSEMKSMCTVLMDGLSTFDTTVYNPSRILRLPLSRHHSGCYTTPITMAEIDDSTIEEIKGFSDGSISKDDIADFWTKAEMPDTIFEMKDLMIQKVKDKVAKPTIEGLPDEFEIEFKNKPTYLTPAKYVLEMGYIPDGFGQEARMILAASYKKAGKDKRQAYFSLKAVSEARVERYGERAKFDKDEMWNNVIQTVYSDSWQGGTYGAFHPLLGEIDDRLPAYLKRKDRAKVIDNASVFDKFKEFARDIDKNTLKFGVPSLDKNLRLLTGTACGVLGVPGSGKSTIVMNLLANNSDKGESSIFYSLDMGESLVALKQIQQVTRVGNDAIFKMVREEPERFNVLAKKAAKQYENVAFSFKFGITPDDIRNDIIEQEEKTGEKVRLVVVDYLESVQSGYADPTVGAGAAAQALASIASELNVLMVVLLQTQKSVRPGEEIHTMRNIKGASVIEQCLSVAIGIYREGQHLKYSDYDCTMGVNILKNRYGKMTGTTIGWDGAGSKIMDMNNDQRLQLTTLRELKAENEAEEAEQRKW